MTLVRDRLAPMIEEAIRLLAPNEDVMWDFAPMVTPAGSQYGLAISIKGAVLNTVLTACAVVGNPWADQDGVSKTVGDLLNFVFQARSEQLQSPGQPPEGLPGDRGPTIAHTTNGQGKH